MKSRIFLSCVANEHLSKIEIEFKEIIIATLKKADFIVEEFYNHGASAGLGWTFENAEKIISRCMGAIIIGAPRWSCEHDKTNSFYLSSEYINYEGAIIHKYKIPTLYIMDNRIKERGIFACGSANVICRYKIEKLSEFHISETFLLQYENWLQHVINKPQLFLGYSHAASKVAKEILKHLEKKYKLKVWDWQRDFLQAHTILTGVIDASERCSGAIFLFMKDKQTKGSPVQALPSNNVTFEAGYFTATKGKGRVLIIKEEGSVMPADLGGDIYLELKDRDNVGSIFGKIDEFVEKNF